MTPSFGVAAREGFHAPGIDEFEWPDLWHLRLFGVDLGINRVVLQMFLVTALVILLFWLGFRRRELVPRGLQNVMESVVDFVRDQIVLEVIGRDGLRYVPYLTTLFLFILLANLSGFVPVLCFPVTARMALPAILALTSTLLFAVGSCLSAAAQVAFELFEAALQAYVFTILSAVYIAGALEPEH